jgi:uncharacterized protein YndB with AHSA1/START domain
VNVKFAPRTVYVTYIASTPEKVWQALTASEFTARYFFGRTVEIEPKAGGSFVMRMPDGRVDVKGEVVDWSPPRRLAVTWTIDWHDDMRQLPPCLVSYDVEPAGEAVKLTVTESYSWDVPEALLSGGRAGWPAILSSLKSLLETGKPLAIAMELPTDMLEALRQAVAAKPWFRS